MYIKLKPIEECKKIYNGLYGIGADFWKNKGWIEVRETSYGKYEVIQEGLMQYIIPKQFVSAVFIDENFGIVDNNDYKAKYEIILKPFNECLSFDKNLCGLIGVDELWKADKIIVSLETVGRDNLVKKEVQYFITTEDNYWSISGYHIPCYFIKSIRRIEEKKPETESITFTKSGNTIKALWLKDGKVVNQSVAKCTKNDTFDMLKGTMVALGKLV